ncbi:cytochrome P450 [Mycobacterium sp. AMU20-3851]|uniref:cytochrome P450 n=1 Tax=Mycobacterium sp. AMU20-3851 TaxID=3122055 RepID=UPI003753F5E0
MSTSALPPGPPLPATVQGVLMMNFWAQYVSACRRRYGDVFTLRVSTVGTMVYLADPADIKTVFGGDPSVYHAGEANAMLTGLLGPSSVLVIDGDVHRDRRRLMLAPFGREAVARQTAVMAEIAADSVAGWPVGTEFAVAPWMSAITLEVILRTVIGTTDGDRLARLRAVMPRLLSLGAWNSLPVAVPRLQRFRPWRGFRDRLDEADRLLYAEITERRADPGLDDRPDALSMMVRSGMSDTELRDQLMTLLVAGHDTTATGLSWALELLTRHPAILEKATHAARTGGPDADDYLDAVCKEVLRIRPVVFDVGRVLTEPTEVAGHLLPAGVMVAPGIGLVHADAARYPHPDRFDPDRMLGATLGPTTYLPFGGGNRRCLGANFAQVEMAVVLREVLRRVDLATTTAPGERQRIKGVILVPHRGARIRVRAVRDAPTPGRASCPHLDAGR